MGYYRQPEKTAGNFVQNPLNKDYPEIIYKTGDLGYYNDRGELMFASRKDYQIKHMGHRIELGEIEGSVNCMEKIAGGCCIYDEEKKNCIILCGRSTADRGACLLKERLPRYMVPGVLRQVDRLPLTLNGKVDRMKLKEMYAGE